MKDNLSTICDLASRKAGLIKTNEIESSGIGRYNLKELVDNGDLVRESKGLYYIPNEKPDEFFLLQSRSSKLFFSYGTALFLHGLSDRIPNSIDITLPQGYNASRLKKNYPSLKTYFVKPELLEYEVENVVTPQGYNVKTYSRERTICEIIKKPDCVDKQIYTQAIKQYFSEEYSARKLIKTAKSFNVEDAVRRYMEVL